MRRTKRKPIVKTPVAHKELPGQHPNARRSVVFIQRLENETTYDLLEGILQTAIEAFEGDNGLGLHEGGGEVRLNTGEILEAMSFGPKTTEMNTSAKLFSQKTGRILATYDDSGNLCLPSGVVLSESNSDAFKW